MAINFDELSDNALTALVEEGFQELNRQFQENWSGPNLWRSREIQSLQQEFANELADHERSVLLALTESFYLGNGFPCDIEEMVNRYKDYEDQPVRSASGRVMLISMLTLAFIVKAKVDIDYKKEYDWGKIAGTIKIEFNLREQFQELKEFISYFIDNSKKHEKSGGASHGPNY